MGTHPIFESDFDCLTVQKRKQEMPRSNGGQGSELNVSEPCGGDKIKDRERFLKALQELQNDPKMATLSDTDNGLKLCEQTVDLLCKSLSKSAHRSTSQGTKSKLDPNSAPNPAQTSEWSDSDSDVQLGGIKVAPEATEPDTVLEATGEDTQPDEKENVTQNITQRSRRQTRAKNTEKAENVALKL